MKTHIETIRSIARKITVTFDETDCNDVYLAILKKMQARLSLPGFRKGKVPFEMIKQRYSDVLSREVHSALLDKALGALKKEMDIAAVVKADFTMQDKGQVLALEVELVPQIDMPDYRHFKLEKIKIEVTEAEVTNFIERLRKQYATYEVVDHPIQSKDYVKVSYEGFIDNHPVDEYPNLPPLWSKQKGTWEEADSTDGFGIPEIIANLKGLKVGDTKEIAVHFPENFAVSALQNKEGMYRIKILEVRRVKLPALDEEFFKKNSVENEAELKILSKRTLQQRKEQEFALQQKQRISEFLIQSVTCDLPITWIKTATEKVLQEMVNLFSVHGIKNQALEEQKASLHEKAQAIACDRIRLNLCFEKIFQKEDLKVEGRDIERVLLQEAAQLHVPPEKLLQRIQSDDHFRADIQNKAFQAKVINWLFETLYAKQEDSSKTLAQTDGEVVQIDTKETVSMKL